MSLDNDLDNDGGWGWGGFLRLAVARTGGEPGGEPGVEPGVDGGRRVRLRPRTRWREFDHLSLPVALGGLDAFTRGAAYSASGSASAPGFRQVTAFLAVNTSTT